jgi:hypothetical protein
MLCAGAAVGPLGCPLSLQRRHEIQVGPLFPESTRWKGTLVRPSQLANLPTSMDPWTEDLSAWSSVLRKQKRGPKAFPDVCPREIFVSNHP